jgi:hypothetical protein
MMMMEAKWKQNDDDGGEMRKRNNDHGDEMVMMEVKW